MERAASSEVAHDPGGIWLVDLKQRAFVALDPGLADDSLMRKVLGSFLAPAHWLPCTGCVAHPVCPIYANARDLGTEEGAATRQRLEYLLTLAHLRGQRHLTLRDLRSGLAYLITGDVGCDDVHAARNADAAMPTDPYWALALGSGGTTTTP